MKYNCNGVSGEGPGVQPAHDPVGHGEDEGVPGGPRDAARPHVPHRQGLPDLPRPAPHLAPEHGQQAQRGTNTPSICVTV